MTAARADLILKSWIGMKGEVLGGEPTYQKPGKFDIQVNISVGFSAMAEEILVRSDQITAK